MYVVFSCSSPTPLTLWDWPALPLAEIAAIRFSAPLMITALSVVLLSEKVRPSRWVALSCRFYRGSHHCQTRFDQLPNIGSIFILLSTLFYAPLRYTHTPAPGDRQQCHDGLLQFAFLPGCRFYPGAAGDCGWTNPNAPPSIVFLFHAWAMPTLLDLIVMAGLGLVWAGGMYFMARAYSLALASVVAPFEYVTLPINTLWGLVLWHQFPTLATWVGAGLLC